MTTHNHTSRTYLREYSHRLRRYRVDTIARVKVAPDGVPSLAADLLRRNAGREEAVRALREKAERDGLLDTVHMLSHRDAVAPVLIPVGATHRQVIGLIANAPA
jgi:hypothetical protein